MKALQFVREATSLIYKTPQEENGRTSKIIEDIMRTARSSVSFIDAEYTSTTRKTHVSGSNYFQQSAQTEGTITRYKGDSGADTKVHPKSVIKYSYSKVCLSVCRSVHQDTKAYPL